MGPRNTDRFLIPDLLLGVDDSTSMVSRPFRPHLRILSQTQAVGLGLGITAPWAGVAPTSARVTNLRDDGGETLSSLPLLPRLSPQNHRQQIRPRIDPLQ